MRGAFPLKDITLAHSDSLHRARLETLTRSRSPKLSPKLVEFNDSLERHKMIDLHGTEASKIPQS